MIVALWIIAACEVIRMVQNAIQLMAIHHEKDSRDNAYNEFVKSLHVTDREFVYNLLREFEKEDPEVKMGCDWYDIPSDLMTLEQARQAVKDLRTSNIHLRMQLEKEENDGKVD